MAIQVPPDATIIADDRLTAIAVIGALAKFVDDGAGKGLKPDVKKSLVEKNERFAQSELALARFSPGERSTVSAAKLYRLVKAGKLTEKQFLEAVSVSRKPLEQYLSGNEIDAISETLPTSGTLTVELIKDIVFDAADIADVLAKVVKQRQLKKAA